jgi:hypothetical protein
MMTRIFQTLAILILTIGGLNAQTEQHSTIQIQARNTGVNTQAPVE